MKKIILIFAWRPYFNVEGSRFNLEDVYFNFTNVRFV